MTQPASAPSAADLEHLADAMVAACWISPGGPYCFTLTAEAVEAIVDALRWAAILRTQH